MATAAVLAICVGVTLLVPSPASTAGAFVPGLAPTPEEPSPHQPPVSAEELQEELEAAVDEYLTDLPPFEVSLAITDGEKTIGFQPDHLIRPASIVKVEILVRWLLVRHGEKLDERELALATDMIVQSDNESANELCRVIMNDSPVGAVPGGTDACAGTWVWSENETSAADQLRVLETALEPGLLSPAEVETVRDLMSGVVPDQAWGVAVADGPSPTWLKNGWDLRDGGWLVNSIGVVGESHDVRIAILTHGHDDFETGKAHVEALADIALTVLAG